MKDNSSNKSRGKRPRVAQKHKTHRTVPNQIGKGFHVKNSWITKKTRRANKHTIDCL